MAMITPSINNSRKTRKAEIPCNCGSGIVHYRRNHRSCLKNPRNKTNSKTKTKKTKTKKITIPEEYDEYCSICTEDKTNFKTLCGHYFCKECLKNWCNQFVNKTTKPTCPNCKKIITTNELNRLGIKNTPLPTGWEIRVYENEPYTGKLYYYHKNSTTCIWERPNRENQYNLIDAFLKIKCE